MTDDLDARGRAMLDAVYGEGFAASRVPAPGHAVTDETVRHLFGEIWNRPGLALRDRRLLVLGATAMLGRADLVEIQARGSLASGDLTAAELREACLQLQFYVGWGNGTQVVAGVEAAIAAESTDSDA